MKLKVGDFVRYKDKNEVGLVGDIKGDKLKCWWHTGGTRSTIDISQVDKLSLKSVVDGLFSNQYAKASLLERELRLRAGKDVSDLIDDKDIRPGITKVLKGL